MYKKSTLIIPFIGNSFIRSGHVTKTATLSKYNAMRVVYYITDTSGKANHSVNRIDSLEGWTDSSLEAAARMQ